jgi:hypothetical protein
VLRAADPAGAVRASLRMSDGAVVRLDAGSALRLASAAAVDLLDGALYADTGAHEAPGRAGAALEVRTDLGTVRDVGTRFMVRLDGSDGRALRVLVREGAVEIDHESGSDVAQTGEEIVVRGDGSLARSPVAAWGEEWDWILAAATPFDLEGRSVAEVLAWVSRETGWTVRYEDDALAAAAPGIPMLGGGPALRDVRPDQAMLLLPAARLEGIVEGGTLTIRRAQESAE